MDFLTKPFGVTWAEILSPSTASTVSCSHTISHNSNVNKGASFMVPSIFKTLLKNRRGANKTQKTSIIERQFSHLWVLYFHALKIVEIVLFSKLKQKTKNIG